MGNAWSAAAPRGKNHRQDVPSLPGVPRPVTFLLTLEARPGVSALKAVRWLVETLRQQHGFRCLDLREDHKRRRPARSTHTMTEWILLREAGWAVDEIERLREALIWMAASPDFAPGGQAREGFERLVQPLLSNDE